MTAGEKAVNAIIAYANHAVFPSGKTSGEFHVMSRMLLWCKGGSGKVTVNYQEFKLGAGDFLFFPWGHRIKYFNNGQQPWSLGGIHIIPDLQPGAPMVYIVRHFDEDTIAGGEFRKDVDLGEKLNRINSGHFDSASSFFHLAEHIVQWFKKGNIIEHKARTYGGLMLDEIESAILNPGPHHAEVPIPLKNMIDFISFNSARKIRMTDLEKTANCSSATVCRLFQKYLRTTPIAWINKVRIEKAANLLLSTDLRINEIALRVGIEDVYYFSKLFRKLKGISASTYRNETALI